MMSGIIIFPAVNRYLLKILDYNGAGIFAYGSRCDIYFINLQNNLPAILDEKSILDAHDIKVTALSFCKNKDVNLLASTGEDHVIKIWDFETNTCIIKTEVKEVSSVLEWVWNSPNIVLFPGEFSRVAKWNILTGSLTKVKTGSDLAISTIVSNANSPDLLAVGLNNGAIIILNIIKESLVCKLRGHSMEITNLCWSPLHPDTLLSTSSDLSARIWKLEEEKAVKIYHASPPKFKNDDKKNLKFYGIFHPMDPDAIICNTSRGDFGSVSFKDNGKPKFHSFLSKPGDSASIYKHLYSVFPCNNNKGGEYVLYSYDQFKINIWDLKEEKLVGFLPFVQSPIYDLTVSPVNPSLLAISCGDGMIRIWNSTNELKLNLGVVYIHYKEKIHIAAWHPTDENLLAFGTSEGRVGIADVFKKKVLFSFESYHHEPVYSVCWGPCPKLSRKDADSFQMQMWYVYSCSNGSVYVNRSHPKSKAVNLDDLIEKPEEKLEKSVSEICWKPDYTCVALGSLKGFIDFFTDSFTFIARLLVQLKSVYCIRWHPEHTYASPNGSPLKSWIAAVGSGDDIQIFDATEILREQNEEKLISRPTKQLVGHSKNIESLSWSQHMDGYLVSGSKDGTAQVWNVCTGSCIANYSSHRATVYALQWSPTDHDTIFSGAMDGSVRIWKISEQITKFPPDKAVLRRRKNVKRAASAAAKMQAKTVEENAEVAPETIDVKHDEKESVSSISDAENKQGFAVLQDGCDMKNQGFKTPRSLKIAKKPKFFPMHSKGAQGNMEEDLHVCMRLADMHYNTSVEEKSDNKSTVEANEAISLGLFTNRLTALQMFDQQMNFYKSHGDKLKLCNLKLVTCNIESAVRGAAVDGALNEFLVSLAPSVSHTFWLEMCEKYAKQLCEEQLYFKAAMYLMMCGKVYDAVNIMAEKSDPIDALAMAKVNLPESDPVILEILQACAMKYAKQMRPEGEAKCCIALNEPLRAAKILCSIPSAKHARVAAYVCKKFGLENEGKEYAFICLERCLMDCDNETFSALLDQEPSISIYKAMVRVHEIFYQHMHHLKNIDAVLLKEILQFDHTDLKRKFWRGSTCRSSEESFLVYVLNTLVDEELLPRDESSLQKMYEALLILAAKRSSCDAPSKAHILIATYITQYIICTLLGDHDLARKFFMKIFKASYNVVFLPRIICSLFLPLDLHWCCQTGTVGFEARNKDNCDKCNDAVLEFQKIYDSFCDKIMQWMKEVDKSFINNKEELSSDLLNVTERITKKLSTKKMEDSLLAYFAANFVNNLLKLVQKKDFELKCHKAASNQPMLQENVTDSKTKEDSHVLGNWLLSKESIKEGLSLEDLIKITKTRMDRQAKILESQKEVNDLIFRGFEETLVIEVNSDSEVVNSEDGKSDFQNTITTNECSNNGPVSEEHVKDLIEIAKVEADRKAELLKKQDEIYAAIESTLKGNSYLSNQTAVNSSNSEDRKSDCQNILTTNECSSNVASAVQNEILQETYNEVDKASNEKLSDALESENQIPNEDLSCGEFSDLAAHQNILAFKHGKMSELMRCWYETNDLFQMETDQKRIGNAVENVTDETDGNLVFSMFKKWININDEGKILSNDKIDEQSKDEVYHNKSFKEPDSLKSTNFIFPISEAENQINVDIVMREKSDSVSDIHTNEDQRKVIDLSTDLSTLYSMIERSPIFTDSHLLCLNDCELMYILLLFMTSVICKDEYALFYYLKDYLMRLQVALSSEAVGQFSDVKQIHSNHCGENLKKELDLSPLKSDGNDISETEQTATKSSAVCSKSSLQVKGDEILVSEDSEFQSDFPGNSNLTTENASIQYDSNNIITDCKLKDSVESNALQAKYKEVHELISLLEKNSEEMPYPDPLDAASKVCEVAYNVMKKSRCEAVQKKFHNFVHAVVFWTEKFSTDKNCTVCQICQKV